MEIIPLPPTFKDTCWYLQDPHLFSFQWVSPGSYANPQVPKLHRAKSGTFLNTSVLPFSLLGSLFNVQISAVIGVYSLDSSHPVFWEVKRERAVAQKGNCHTSSQAMRMV